MYIQRIYNNLNKYIFPHKALILFGSRQVGKTTLIKKFLADVKEKYKYDTGDNLKTRNIIGSEDVKLISEYLSGYNLYVIDEAQRIPNIGSGLKIIIDNIPNVKLIATGSSSFELSGQIGEPLTGRKKTLELFPIAQEELLSVMNKFELKEKLEEILIFGSYPEVITRKTKAQKIEILNELTNSYLLKDILALEKVKNSQILLDLLRLIAFQIGSEVSLNELGRQLNLDVKTIKRYLDLLEKSFIIYNLRGFSKNLRKEITKKSKYYFLDNGVRNAIIANFNGINLRDDIGKLWENFIVSERLKAQNYNNIYANNYFWRTWEGAEIDWLEEREGKLFAYEFKYNKANRKEPKIFKQTYPNSDFNVITKENYLEFLLK